MGRRRRGEPPKLCRHKSSGQGYVTIHGKREYLGAFGSPECRRNYRDVLKRFEDRQTPRAVRQSIYLGAGATVKQLVTEFMKAVADVKYQIDGEKTSTHNACRLYLVDGLAAQYGAMLADDFRHPEFEEFRLQYLERGYARNSMKILTGRVLALFRWGHRRGAVSAETLTSLKASPEPDEGEEREPIAPVPADVLALVLATLEAPEPPPDVPGIRRDHYAKRRRQAAMMRLQELVGMRPGELCRMRGKEIDREGKVRVGNRIVQVAGPDGEPYCGWIFQPGRHKTMKKGKTVAYLIGPKARAILEAWLPADPDAYVWRGKDGSGPYQLRSYREGIYEACQRAKVSRFGPHKLRHTCVTKYGQVAGIEKAGQVVSHQSLDATARYFERTLGEISGLVEQFG